MNIINKYKNQIQNTLKLFNGYKPQFLIVLVIIISISITEMFSVSMIYPILESIINSDNASINFIFIDRLLKHFSKDAWTLIVILMLVLFSILSFLLKILNVYYSQKIMQNVQLNWRMKLLDKYINSVYEYVLKSKHGDIMHNISQEAARVGNLVNTLLQWISDSLIGLSIYSLLLITNLYLTLFLTIFILFIFLFAKFIGENFQFKISKQLIEIYQNQSSIVSESVLSLQQVKIFTMENNILNKYKMLGEKSIKLFVKQKTIGKIPSNLPILLLSFVLLGFFIFYEFFLNVNLKDALPTMGLIFVGFTKISASLMTVVRNRILIFDLLPSLQLIENIINSNVQREQIEKGEDFKELNTDIEFKDVTFGYPNDIIVFQDLNFTIHRNKINAIIGPSGSGKSTITYLLTRLYDFPTGQIIVNGTNITSYSLKSLRQKIGYVSQDTYIFNMSIKENIKIGKPDATEEEIYKAAELAYCNEFIDKMPEKWETVVGDRGMKLSGGQRQRIAIARALIRKPEIYIFDEATSSLDNYSEKLIQKSIEEIGKNSTVIIIAHRLTTIENADFVIDLALINN